MEVWSKINKNKRLFTCTHLITLISNVTVDDSITKVTNYYIVAMITNSIIHFLVTMFTLSNIANAPIFTSYHCPLVAMVKEHTRRVPLYRHCLTFLHHTHRTMKFQCTVNQLARVICTHYLENSSTGVYNITIKCSWVDKTNTQYTHICTKQMKSENKLMKPQCCINSSTQYQSSM